MWAIDWGYTCIDWGSIISNYSPVKMVLNSHKNFSCMETTMARCEGAAGNCLERLVMDLAILLFSHNKINLFL